MRRALLLLSLSGLLVLAHLRISAQANLAGHVEVTVDPLMPARVYLFRGEHPFRLSPVEALMPLRVDLYYRERLWRRTANPTTLEVTFGDQSHFFLLTGKATFELPAGKYRMEAYRGFFYEPAVVNFEVRAGERQQVRLPLRRWTRIRDWISGDDHIHLVRAPEDNSTYLGWLQAEDLSVGNFLQLQRQMDAAQQYAFGREGEARRPGYSIRSGHESRSQYYGHINLLGGRRILRPLSIGPTYGNGPGAYPFPGVLFQRGREVGATVGFAHFRGSTAHSTMLMDAVLGKMDFLEVFQFGKLWTPEWYQFLNAGLKATGIAGSDFPVPLTHFKPWPRWLPLLGPERTLVKAKAGLSAYDAWADGVRRGDVVVSNGPLVELKVEANGSAATATAEFFRPLEVLEIVRNGEVIATAQGDGSQTSLQTSVSLPNSESAWVAARVRAKSFADGPPVQAHTNPRYVLQGGRPVMVRAAREAVAEQWQKELEYYKSAGLPFATDAERKEFFEQGEKALTELRRPL